MYAIRSYYDPEIRVRQRPPVHPEVHLLLRPAEDGGAARLASDAERDLRTRVWDGWEITEYLGVSYNFV